MENRNGFASGFIAGTLFGSIVGGFVGALLATKVAQAEAEGPLLPGGTTDEKLGGHKQRQIRANHDLKMEQTRQGLEEKIAQLNSAIDDVRQQLSNVNGRE